MELTEVKEKVIVNLRQVHDPEISIKSLANHYRIG